LDSILDKINKILENKIFRILICSLLLILGGIIFLLSGIDIYQTSYFVINLKKYYFLFIVLGFMIIFVSFFCFFRYVFFSNEGLSKEELNLNKKIKNSKWKGYGYREYDIDLVGNISQEIINKQFIFLKINDDLKISGNIAYELISNNGMKKEPRLREFIGKVHLFDNKNNFFAITYITNNDSIGIVLAELIDNGKKVSGDFIVKHNKNEFGYIKVLGKVELEKQ
jgi:hypothetical protein